MSILRRSIQRGLPGGFDWGDGGDTSGTTITAESATGISAVWAATERYASTIASLPVGVYLRDRGVRRPVTRPRWLDHPQPADPNATRFDLIHGLVTSVMLYGNGYLFVLFDERTGEPVEVRVLDSRKVDVKRGADGAPVYMITTAAGTASYSAENIVHVKYYPWGENLKGLSPVEQHRTTLGLAKATTEYAAHFYANGAAPSGIVKVPGELTADQADRLRSAFKRRNQGLRNMQQVAVLTGGADFSPMQADIAKMQMTETMQISVEQVARIYGIPLHMLQASNATTSFASVEAIGIEWLRLGLGPMIARIEAALQRLIIGDTTFIKFNTDGLMRTTTKERLEALSIALASGMLSINEARAIEDRAPIGPAGDEYYMPLNMAVVGSDKGQA